MCGNQFGFNYKSTNDIDKLFSIVIDKIDESLQGYGLSDDDIVWVQLTFRVVDVKLYDNAKLWVNTKPVFINDIDKSLTVRRPLDLVNSDLINASCSKVGRVDGKMKWFKSTWYRIMLSVLLLVSLLAYLASYLIDDTNH